MTKFMWLVFVSFTLAFFVLIYIIVAGYEYEIQNNEYRYKIESIENDRKFYKCKKALAKCEESPPRVIEVCDN